MKGMVPARLAVLVVCVYPIALSLWVLLALSLKISELLMPEGYMFDRWSWLGFSIYKDSYK